MQKVKIPQRISLLFNPENNDFPFEKEKFRIP